MKDFVKNNAGVINFAIGLFVGYSVASGNYWSAAMAAVVAGVIYFSARSMIIARKKK